MSTARYDEKAEPLSDEKNIHKRVDPLFHTYVCIFAVCTPPGNSMGEEDREGGNEPSLSGKKTHRHCERGREFNLNSILHKSVRIKKDYHSKLS